MATDTFMGLGFPLFPKSGVEVAAQTDDILISWGVSATSQKAFDMKWFGGDASGASYLYFDASADEIATTKLDLKLNASAASTYLLWDVSANKLVSTGKVELYLKASAAGARLNFVPASNKLTLRASGAVRTFLDMGNSVAEPTTGSQGLLFMLRTSTTFRLGVCSTGTTKKYTTKFNYTKGSSS